MIGTQQARYFMHEYEKVSEFFISEKHEEKRSKQILDWFYSTLRPCVDSILRVIMTLKWQKEFPSDQYKEHVKRKVKELYDELKVYVKVIEDDLDENRDFYFLGKDVSIVDICIYCELKTIEELTIFGLPEEIFGDADKLIN